MTNEQNIFLQILSDHIAGRKTASPPELDWQRLLHYADRQEMGGIVYYQCKEYLNTVPALADINSRLSQIYAAHTFYYINRAALVEEVRAKFAEESIPVIVVKGMETAQLYPFPALRTMGDTDLVVHPEDKKRAGEALLQLGFRVDYNYWKDDMEFELHDCLIYPGSKHEATFADYFNNFWVYVKDGKLSWEFHLMFLLVHLRKHLVNSGVGFRQFMDIAVITKSNGDNMDWQWTESELERLGLLPFAKKCFAFCEKWFGVPAPISIEPLDDAFYESATEKIFLDGVFGFDNADNKASTVGLETHGGRLPHWLAGLKTMLGRVFPSYDALRVITYYSFIDGKPFLLPVAWLYRFFRGVFDKGTRSGKELLRTSFASKEKVRERVDALEKWGI